MKNLAISASLVTILFQYNGIMAQDSIAELSADVLTNSGTRSYQNTMQCLHEFFENNPIETKGLLSKRKYRDLTIYSIMYIIALERRIRSDHGALSSEEVNLERFKRTVGKNSSLRELAIQMAFFDKEAVSKEMLRRLYAASNANAKTSLLARISKNSQLLPSSRAEIKDNQPLADAVLLEYIWMISCVYSAFSKMHRENPVMYIDKEILERIKPDIEYILAYKNIEKNREKLERSLRYRIDVGFDDDDIARALLIIVNALLYSDIDTDSDGYYTKFLKEFPGLRIENWVLPRGCLSNLKLDMALRVIALNDHDSNTREFISRAADIITTLDPQQCIRVIRRVHPRQHDDVISKTRFDGQKPNGEVEDMAKYTKDFFAFLNLLFDYRESFYYSNDFKRVFDTFLTNSKFETINSCTLESLGTIHHEARLLFIKHCLNSVNINFRDDIDKVVEFFLKYVPSDISKIVGKINFRDMTEDQKIDFLCKTCTWKTDFCSLFSAKNMHIIDKALPNNCPPKDFVLKIIREPNFCAFPELIATLKTEELVDGEIANALLYRAKTSDGMSYNIMSAVASIYNRLCLIDARTDSSASQAPRVDKRVLHNIANELILFGDALKYLSPKTANNIVRLWDGIFTFAQTNFLLQYVTAYTMIEKLMKRTLFQNIVLEPLIILNKSYPSYNGSAKNCTRSIIIEKLAKMSGDGYLDVQLAGRLLRVLPEKFIPLLLQKSNLKKDWQIISKILIHRFNNHLVCDDTNGSDKKRKRNDYQMIALLADAAGGDITYELKDFLLSRMDGHHLYYMNMNLWCSTERLAEIIDGNLKNQKDVPLNAKSNLIYKIEGDIIPDAYKELLLKKLTTGVHIEECRCLLTMLLDYIHEHDKRPFTLEEFTCLKRYLSELNNFGQKIIDAVQDMYDKREIALSNDTATAANAPGVPKNFLEDAQLQSTSEFYSNDNNRNDSSSSVSPKKTPEEFDIINTQVLVGKEYENQKVDESSPIIPKALIDLNRENLDTPLNQPFNMKIVWNSIKGIYGCQTMEAYSTYMKYKFYNGDDGNDGNDDDDLPKHSPEPEWVKATRRVSPPPYSFYYYSFYNENDYCYTYGNEDREEHRDDDENYKHYLRLNAGFPVQIFREKYTIIQEKILQTLENIPWIAGIVNSSILSRKTSNVPMSATPITEDSVYSIQTSSKNPYKISLMPFYILPNRNDTVPVGHGKSIEYPNEIPLNKKLTKKSSLVIAPSKYPRPLENCYAYMLNNLGAQMMKNFIFEPCDFSILMLINDERNYLKTRMGNNGNKVKLKAHSSSSSSSS
ncbi:MAG: hypothetical protein LBB21_05345, partial [Holosporaceae bacterium]|nr:hypothetical protein [Holosporaceae bacterium]